MASISSVFCAFIIALIIRSAVRAINKSSLALSHKADDDGEDKSPDSPKDEPTKDIEAYLADESLKLHLN